MTRPRVDPEKRQRTANACDSCKRRKQKCDGSQPCNTCAKRNFECIYAIGEQNLEVSTSLQTSPKRLRRDTDPTGIAHEVGNAWTPKTGNYASDHSQAYEAYRTARDGPSLQGGAKGIGAETPQGSPNQRNHEDGHGEAENHTMSRMVLDPTGRQIYLGDAATITFLQIIRQIVESTVGECPLTQDPKRNQLTEVHLKLPADIHLTHQLPQKKTALILVDAYFTHMHGIVEIFDEHEFINDLHKCYEDPLSPNEVYLCHLNLVFSIGLSFATPEVGSHEARVIEAVRSKHPDQAELFFLHAKIISDPFVGFEDGDLWTVQALLLMAIFMITKAKRNTAAAYIGMAVRTSYALGLHREDANSHLTGQEQLSRRRLWRSLFIMDRLLASALGRPVAIAEEECSGDILNPKAASFTHESHISTNMICASGLEAACRSCHVVGLVLRRVYLQRRVSTRVAQELADECKIWPANLPYFLHWKQASARNRRQAIAIMHVNTMYCHSIILLSRPFFLYVLSTTLQRQRTGGDQAPQPIRGRIAQFAHACLAASWHTIALIQNAYEGGYLSKVEPFVTYTLFAAALNIFANELTRERSTPLTSASMANSITIMSYCGESDQQAKRAAEILINFRDVLNQKRSQSATPQQNPYQEHLTNTEPALEKPVTYGPVPNQGWLPVPPLPGATVAPTSDPNMISTVSSNPFHIPTPGLPYMQEEDAFSGLLDPTTTVLPSSSNAPSASPEEAIEFDSIWGLWPPGSATHIPAVIAAGQNGIGGMCPDGNNGPGMYHHRGYSGQTENHE